MAVVVMVVGVDGCMTVEVMGTVLWWYRHDNSGYGVGVVTALAVVVMVLLLLVVVV